MAMAPGATFRTIDESHPGSKLAAVFAARAEAYAAWYLQDGDQARPSTPWAAGNDVSLHGEQPLEHGVLRILVEKDFTCVEPRDGEDQSDLYPNPATAQITVPEK